MEDKPESHKGLDKRITVNMGSINLIYNANMVDTVIDIFNFENVDSEFTDKIKEEGKKRIREAKDIGQNSFKQFLDSQPKMLIEVNMSTPQIILPLDKTDMINSPCWIFYPGNLNVIGDTYTRRKDDPNYDIYSIRLEDIQFVYCDTIKSILANQMSIQEIRTSTLPEFLYIFKNFTINIDILILKSLFVNLNCIDARFKVRAKLNALKVSLNTDLLAKL